MECSEFEYDKISANRIVKVVEMYPMSLSDCADILEAVAPLCSALTSQGVTKMIKDLGHIIGYKNPKVYGKEQL